MNDNLQKLITWSLDNIEQSDDICIEIDAIDSILALCSGKEGFYAIPLLRLKKVLIASLNKEYSNMLENVLIELMEKLHGAK